jgi:hypothetical protein
VYIIVQLITNRYVYIYIDVNTKELYVKLNGNQTINNKIVLQKELID